MLLAQELFQSDYGMFKDDDETHLKWFADTPLESEEVFELVGKLVGLALYNFQIINLPFPLVLFKKLLNEQPKFDDLSELSPTTAKSLKSLLEYEGDDIEELFDLTFEVTKQGLDSPITVPLKDNGENIRINQTNK